LQRADRQTGDQAAAERLPACSDKLDLPSFDTP
jgi:hypothetical protein